MKKTYEEIGEMGYKDGQWIGIIIGGLVAGVTWLILSI